MSNSNKVVLKGKELKLIFIILSLVIISFLLYKHLEPMLLYKPLNLYNYHGQILTFRADLREAKNVQVYPDDTTIFEMVMNPNLKNVTIVFVPSKDNGIVGVDGFEVSRKLAIAYNYSGYRIPIKGEPVDSYELSGTNDSLIIALIPPVFSNDTSVRAKNNVILISGKTYKGFDLSTIRFLMIILEIKLSDLE